MIISLVAMAAVTMAYLALTRSSADLVGRELHPIRVHARTESCRHEQRR